MATRRKPDFDVALSFASEDRPFVERVADILKESNIRVFYDKDEEVDLWGKDLLKWLNEVYRRRSKYVIMFISKPYAKKMWPNFERRTALERAIRQRKEYILPARFDKTQVPGIRSSLAYIDLKYETPESFASKIIRKVRGPADLNHLRDSQHRFLGKFLLQAGQVAVEKRFKIVRRNNKRFARWDKFQIGIDISDIELMMLAQCGYLEVYADPPSVIFTKKVLENASEHLKHVHSSSPDNTTATF